MRILTTAVVAILILAPCSTVYSDTVTYDGFVAVWRKIDQERKFGSFANKEKLLEKNDEMVEKGYQMVWINAGRSIDHQFQAIWAKRDGKSFIEINRHRDVIKLKDQAYFQAGFRISSLSVRGKGDDAAYSGIWRKDDGGQWWRSRMSTDDFKETDSKHFKNGYRIKSLQRDADEEFTVVWHPGSGEQRWRSGMSFKELKAQMKQYSAKGLHLATVDIEDDLEYTAVWRSGGSSEDRLVAGYSWQRVKEKDAELAPRGYRMTVLRADMFGFDFEPGDTGDGDGGGGGSSNGGSCGKENQPCCAKHHCKLDFACNTQTGKCREASGSGCGSIGHLCCTVTSGNLDGCSSSNCVGNVCQPCGGKGEDCCVSDAGAMPGCGAGFKCNGSTCAEVD